MAVDSINKLEYRIRDISTSSVTFFPGRARVIRDIQSIELQPGINEVTIDGITPTAIEDSIVVDASGSTNISDVSVKLIVNPEDMEEVYPESDHGRESEEDDLSDEEYPQDDEIKSLEDDLRNVEREYTIETDVMNAVDAEHQLLNSLYTKLTEYTVDEIKDGVESYAAQRASFAERKVAAIDKTDDLAKRRKALRKKLVRLRKDRQKLKSAKEKERKDKNKEKAQERKKRDQLQRELQVERNKFWPRSIYRVSVTLEIPGHTPASSRRGSIDSTDKQALETVSARSTVSLQISYITESASWAPRYDLQINTPSSSALLVYRAETRNTTSETWKDAKICLSTSQTAFTGLNDNIPVLQAWYVHLVKTGSRGAALKNSQEEPYWSLNNPQVQLKKGVFSNTGVSNNQKPNAIQNTLFGGGNNASSTSNNIGQAIPPPPGGGLFGNAPAPQPGGGLFGSTNANTGGVPIHTSAAFGASNDTADEGDGATLGPFAESESEAAWEETGLTTTYDVPGKRTISPSSTHRRLKISTVELSKMTLTHMCVPKLRQSAFLKARITNTSSVALLKGKAGLTIDGTFLGGIEIPRCEPGDVFPLSLGVDPSVKVEYAPPSVKKNLQSGLLNKQDSSIYERIVSLSNTKSSGAPLNITVLDQVPVSQDERLKIDVSKPSGLKAEGPGVSTGEAIRRDNISTSTSGYSLQAARGVTGKNEKWGKAVAEMKKNGFVEWKVSLNPSSAVKLALTYETKYPAGENVANSMMGNR